MYLLLLIALLVTVAGLQVRWAYRRRRLAAETWETVLCRAEEVDLEGIRAIAECYLRPDRNQLRIEPNEMWTLLGGLEGMARLRKNAAAMLELAVWAERWNDTEGPVVTEMIRRDAVRVRRSVMRVQLGFLFGVGFLRAPFHVQEAAATYYLMRSRLLGVYENCHAGLVPRLEAAF